MILDTGSDWLWIDSVNCFWCPSVPKYDETQSSTFSYLDDEEQTISYGSGDVTAYKVEDQVCITPDHCAEDFQFMLVVWEEIGVEVSGLVGLSPNGIQDRSDLFIEKMKTAGAIDHAIFSFSIGMDDVQSKIIFGGYDLDTYATGPINWH